MLTLYPQDELDSRLTHSGRGVLAMANSGERSAAKFLFSCFSAADTEELLCLAATSATTAQQDCCAACVAALHC